MNLDDYNIHVIASVFKQWLRDLPNPLMTFELYEEFLRAMGKEPRRMLYAQPITPREEWAICDLVTELFCGGS